MMSQGFEVVLKWNFPHSSSGSHKTPEYHVHFSKASSHGAVALSSSVTLTTGGGAHLAINDGRLTTVPVAQPATSEPEDVEMIDADMADAGPVAV